MQDVTVSTNETQKFERQTLTYLPWDFVAHITNIYPDYDFIPLHKAITQKKNITALVGFKGKGATIAKLFGFEFWNIQEGLYRLSGHTPCSFMLERFGDYTDSRKPSEWEEWMQAIPEMLNRFDREDNPTILQSKESIIENSDGDCPPEQVKPDFSPFMERLYAAMPSAFPALAPYDREEAIEMIKNLLGHRLSSDKYAPDASPYQLYTPSGRKRVVLIDQERMSKSELDKVQARESSFMEMLESAKKHNPGAAFFLLEPKAIRSGKSKGYLRSVAEANGVQIIKHDVSSLSILEQAEAVYTVSSQLGLDAIFLGKKVYCFGMPFYAGFGLTKDMHVCDRREPRTREELFSALCLYFTRYRHPVTEEPSSFREILRFIILQRPLAIERNRFIACIHFDDKLEKFCRRFFSHSDLHFMPEEAAIKEVKRKQGMIFTAKEPDDAMRKACGSIPLVFVNIGVLDRLLGQDKFVSLSLEGGGYPTLDRILQTSIPQDRDLLRARLFRQYLREISAFRTHHSVSHIPKEQNIVLLLGNGLLPPSKLSIQEETAARHGNLDAKGRPINSFSSPLSDDAKLIAHIRGLRPQDYIIYCPQVEGLKIPKEILSMVDDIKPMARPSDFVPLSLLGLAPHEEDETEEELAIAEVEPSFIDDPNECVPVFEDITCTTWSRKYVAAKRFLEKAHNMTTVQGQFCPLYFPVHSVQGHTIEVHTYDSYLGLDALSVGMDVFTYGWPFYAGWGLTKDVENFPLRTRHMNLEVLFAGAFILQPRYFDSKHDIFCEPENTPFLLMRDSEK